MENIMNFKG